MSTRRSLIIEYGEMLKTRLAEQACRVSTVESNPSFTKVVGTSAIILFLALRNNRHSPLAMGLNIFF